MDLGESRLTCMGVFGYQTQTTIMFRSFQSMENISLNSEP